MNIQNKNNIYFIQAIILSIILGNIQIVFLSDVNTAELTSIIKYSLSDLATSYATVTVTQNGNLICSSSFFGTSTLKYYYGIKSNGRPLFIKNNKEIEFSSTDSDKARNEGNIYGIKLSSSTDDKEYIIAIGNNEANVEVYDFSDETPIIYLKNGNSFFSSEYNSFKYSNLFKLKNGDNIYLLSIILQIQESGSYKFFNLFKLSFSSPDIYNNNPIIKSFKFKSATLSYTSCFETESNYIICFCISEYSVYTIASFDYNINSVLNYHFINNAQYYATIFYKCIHFTQNAGVFLYFSNSGNICFDFIKYESNSFQIYFDSTYTNLNPIQINSIYNTNVQKNDLFKLADKKFCYITISSDNKELHLFIFNNFSNEKFIIRHYTVKTSENNGFSFGQELRATVYNDYIGLATVGYLSSTINYSYLILFSYPNSTDFNLDITETIKNEMNVIINFNDHCKIENNIFGYENKGIQLLEISDGLKLINEEDKSIIITKNSIFSGNVELIIEDNINLNSNLRIEFALVVKDPSYDLYKGYSEIINNNLCIDSTNTCNEETQYEEKEHIGRTSYCDIFIDSSQISKDCDENCLLCDSNTKECFYCKDDSTNCKMENSPTSIPYLFSTSINNPEFISTIINKEIQNSSSNCIIEDILNNKCSDGQVTLDQLEEIKNKLINSDYSGENTIIETETVIIQLSTLEDQMNQDNTYVSNIDLGECEEALREDNDIDDDEDLIIYKTDIKTSDSSTTYVIYEVYDASLNKLNLSVCSDTQISINIPVKLDNSLESLAKSLSDSGYNIFNENDSFYNDICATYTNENGTDMLLSDRKADIYGSTLNQTFCQTGCELESYNTTSKKAKCNCNVVTNTEISSLNIDNLFDKKEVAKSFYKTLANSNFQVMRCFKLILHFSNFFKNYGEIIMTILIFFFLIMMIIYLIFGTRHIHKYLINILKWNLENSQNHQNKKNNKLDDESIANSENKVISIENKEVKKKSKNTKKIKFNLNNAPPKKRKNQTEIALSSNINKQKNKKNKKFIGSTNEISNIKLETMSVNKLRNKKNRNKPLEKNEIRTFKDLDTKKNIRETEANNNNEIVYIDNTANKIKNMTDNELDELEYEIAIIYDNRTFFQYYWSVLKQNQLIIFTFLPMNDYNLIYVKIALFIISFGLFFTINGFFFSDDTMHKVYEDNGEFDITYQISQIFYSSIISSFANILLKNLSLSEKNIIKLKDDIYLSMHKGKKKARQIERCLKVKLILFFIISFILMIFFWYFISCFCAVYKNTQIILIKDTGISFGTSMLYPFILSFLPGFFRIPALRAKNKNLKYLYMLSSIINWVI